MGRFYTITCRNKECQYKVDLYEGPGMIAFARTRRLQDDILEGRQEAPEIIKELLRKGYKLDCVTTFLCPSCNEWQTQKDPYIFEKIKVSPMGTVREYKLHFINGVPVCEKCGTELQHILNPRSSKNRCPKCGSDNMRVGGFGCYD